MDFALTQDRQMLADTLNRFLGDRYPIEERHAFAASDIGFSRDIWGQFAELGVIGALFNEAEGGFGGAGHDLSVVFEAAGRALVVEPLLGALMAGRVLADRSDLIEGIISGATIPAFAHFEPEGRYDPEAITTRAEMSGEGWCLTGAKSVVAQVGSADVIVVSARVGDDLGLFLVPSGAQGVAVRQYPLIDGGSAGELTLDNVRLDIDARLGSVDAASAVERAIAAGIVALCAEAVGIMDVLRDATLEYLRTRVQFGVVIGKFQALQHRMATVALEIEQARSATINAANALEGSRVMRERAVSAAKYTIGYVGRLVAEEAIQLHGGIGMTTELSVSHYAKRLTMIDHQLGDEDHHLERFAALPRPD